jgi:hypothetical protein
MTDYQEACIRQEAAQAMKANCVEFLQTFAQEYVEKWVGKSGDGAKAEGWAILQAMVALRDSQL